MKVELRKGKAKRFPSKKFPEFEKIDSNLYVAYMPKRKAISTINKAEKYGLYGRYYDEKYDRNNKYRTQYIKKHKPVDGYYRCVYCGKLLTEEEMEVDHVIPVAAAKSSKKARRLLRGKGVNNSKNLVSACHKCNQKKGTSYGIKWRLRARFGKYTLFWALKYSFYLLLIAAVVLYISMQDFSPIEDWIKTVLAQFR